MTPPWVIVLAGGEGRRFRPAIERWLGVRRPKQFCAVIGSRSMVQHALDRAATITDVDRIVTVIGPGQRALLASASASGSAGTVIEQPMDRGSASAVMMALAHILVRDADANVLVLPAAQFAHPEDRFVACLKRASRVAQEHKGRLVLLSARARYAESNLGWVVPGERLGDLARVSWIRQRPPRAGAERLLRNGAHWNTQIFVARGMDLWRLGHRCAPGLAECFAVIAMTLQRKRAGISTLAAQDEIVSLVYDDLPHSELTSTLLMAAREQMLVLCMEDVLWADWSRPEWVIETLGHFDHTTSRGGEPPLHPLRKLAAVGLEDCGQAHHRGKEVEP